MSPVLAVFKNVAKSFNGFPALKGVSFEIKEGEIFGFIGPNGAGKTTTMKILVGLLSEFSGSLTVSGLPLPGDRRKIHRMIGYMPQGVAFQEWRTVNHALTTFGRLSGLASAEVASRIPIVLSQVGLDDVRHKKIIHLSGGMVQKLGLAQALLHEPKLLVLDEPLSGLDPGSRIQVKAVLREFADHGTTVFFSSHILSDVQDAADRIGILSGGRLLKIGTLDDLKSHFSAGAEVEIILARDAGNWAELRAVAGVKAIEKAAPGRLLLRLEPSAAEDDALNEIIRKLLSGGNKIRSFKPLAASLDELFLKYVGQGEIR